MAKRNGKSLTEKRRYFFVFRDSLGGGGFQEAHLAFFEKNFVRSETTKMKTAATVAEEEISGFEILVKNFFYSQFRFVKY